MAILVLLWKELTNEREDKNGMKILGYFEGKDYYLVVEQ